ncbi:hypothetical protein ABQD82_14650 [Enterococcus gallinarum]|uniref:hypothetical protein n=1 Tax=Enterococcus gallinarum TaxID=1353 RepID=UPI0032E3F58C
MSISFEKLKSTLKETGFLVFRDKAQKGTDYPYIVYSIVNKGRKKASSKVYKRLPYYQISFFTDGDELNLLPLEKALETANIPFVSFSSQQGDENNDTITNFYTYVRCVEDA